MFSIRTIVKILPYPKGGRNLLITRGIKAYRVVRRKELPRYKRDLTELLPLTKYLTINESDVINQQLTLENVWKEKLATYKSYLPMNFEMKYVLLEAMYNPNNDIDSLLRIIRDNLDTMTSFYIANSFEVLDDFIRYTNQQQHVIVMAPEFKALCRKALYKMRFFESDEVLKVMKCLASLQLPENTIIVQSTLQMARHLINEFDYDELRTLLMSLELFEILDQSRKSLLVTLKEVIPLALKRQEKYKLLSGSSVQS